MGVPPLPAAPAAVKPKKLAAGIGVPVEEAEFNYNAYIATYPTVKRFFDTSVLDCRETLKAFTLLGRRRFLPEINGYNKYERYKAARQAGNTIIQGTAGTHAQSRAPAQPYREAFLTTRRPDEPDGLCRVRQPASALVPNEPVQLHRERHGLSDGQSREWFARGGARCVRYSSTSTSTSPRRPFSFVFQPRW